MIVAYAGRRAESLPAGADGQLLLRLRRLIMALAPTAVVGPAADGGDILVLEAALGSVHPAKAYVVLPTSRSEFRESSVEASWRDRHDRVLERVERDGSVEALDLEDGEDAYRAANARVLERAAELAGEDERLVVLIVASPGEGMMVEDFIYGAQLRGLPVLRIDPAVDLAGRPRAFVAMPFGDDKRDPQRGITVNCDEVYKKVLIPALEHAQLRYSRADERIDSGVVLQPMIEDIANADLVIGDLQTANFNVGWELGLRHLLRSRHTLLVAPEGIRAPFDVEALRHVTYRQDERGVDDQAAIDAWAALAPFLEALDGPQQSGSDSPVAAVMDVRSWARVAPREQRDAVWESLRERLAVARDLRDPQMTLGVVAEAAGLDEERRALVAAEAGVGLIRDGAYDEGIALLGPLVEADAACRRPDAHFYYAQGLYKPKDAAIGRFDQAEGVFKRLLVACPEFPEVWAGLGAIYKRRARRRTVPEESRRDVVLAMQAYEHDFDRDLRAFYEGINFVACGVLLERVYGDREGGDRARRALPVVAFAAERAARLAPRDFWAKVTVAEVRLYEALLGAGGANASADAVDAYADAGSLRPPAGYVDSALDQLRGLIQQGVIAAYVGEAARRLTSAAGCPERADGL